MRFLLMCLSVLLFTSVPFRIFEKVAVDYYIRSSAVGYAVNPF